jgi:hypothetical protein
LRCCGEQGASAIDYQTEPEAERAPPDIGEFAPGIIKAAMVRVKAVMAVWTPLTVVPRSVAMLLMATFIVVAAKLHRN